MFAILFNEKSRAIYREKKRMSNKRSIVKLLNYIKA
jgi:hypothetical protein